MEENSQVDITGSRDVAIVTFRTSSISNPEEITTASKQVNEFISKNKPKRIVFDFGEVKFFCSRVLGLLLETRAKLEADGGEVVISAINPQLYRVFKITNLDKIFKFFPDRKSAVGKVKTNQV